MKDKTIALIAHDHKKVDMIAWSKRHQTILSNYRLVGTGTTASLIKKETGLEVYGYLSGPLGGDLQIGAALANQEIDLVIFLADPLTAQPHDPDVKALLRIAEVYNIPMAINIASANLILTSFINE